jgi:hypothetical protein
LDYEPVLVATALAGSLAYFAMRNREGEPAHPVARADLLVLGAFVVPYSTIIGLYDHSYERFLLPLLPLLILYVAWLLSSLVSRLRTQRLGRMAWGAGSALCGVVLALQAALGLRLALAYGASDTLTQCAGWIRESIPPGSARIAVLFQLDLPLLRTRAALETTPRLAIEPTRPWLRYQWSLSPDVLEEERYGLFTAPGSSVALQEFLQDMPVSMREWDADYVIVMARTIASRFDLDQAREHLRRSARLVARFSPYGSGGGDQAFWYERGPRHQGWWTAHLLRAKCTGPVVEVYATR